MVLLLCVCWLHVFLHRNVRVKYELPFGFLTQHDDPVLFAITVSRDRCTTLSVAHSQDTFAKAMMPMYGKRVRVKPGGKQSRPRTRSPPAGDQVPVMPLVSESDDEEEELEEIKPLKKTQKGQPKRGVGSVP